KLPDGPSTWRRSPSRTPSFTWFDTRPPATRLMVIVTRDGSAGSLDAEYARRTIAPSMGTSSVKHGPGANGTGGPAASSSTSDAASGVSRTTDTTRTVRGARRLTPRDDASASARSTGLGRDGTGGGFRPRRRSGTIFTWGRSWWIERDTPRGRP